MSNAGSQFIGQQAARRHFSSVACLTRHERQVIASQGTKVQSFSLLFGGIRARIIRVVHLIPLGVDVDVQLFQDRVTQLERIVV
jgi:hypothetical protein